MPAYSEKGHWRNDEENKWLRTLGLINHVLVTSMQSMFDLAIIRMMIEKHEKYYKGHVGKDIDCSIIENNHFKEIIGDVHGKIREKIKRSPN